MQKELGITILGTVEVVDDALMVTDPCYDGGDKEIENLKSGTWICETCVMDEPGWGKRNVYLAMYHMSHKYVHTKFELDENYGAGVGVDSGQVGMFLLSSFEDNRVHDDLYDDICDLTCGSTCGGGPVRDSEGRIFGFATSSGCGDGSYDLFMKLDELTNEVIAVEVVYLNRPSDPRFLVDEDHLTESEDEDGYL